ncbi:MAG: L,D-transpeptidase family protein [Verrucomicrobia bacterium]|nr:L,D-transpeptidase family protein [Verrucomicrobiota bacterium]
MTHRRILFIALFFLAASSARAAALPDDCGQLIVGLAPDWNSMRGQLFLLEKSDGKWTKTLGPEPVLFGKNGLAWGRGIAGQDEQGLHKRERDGRAPAGIFRIGKIYTYDAQLPPGSDYPFHQVTDGDIWSDDPRSPNYNRHVVIDPRNPPDNYSHEKMRPGDFAYHWLIEIRHNSDPPVPGDGSAIFFHIRRGVDRPTTGCTTMAEENLVRVIKWLREAKHPCYALLPEAEYRSKWEAWHLPSPELLGLP